MSETILESPYRALQETRAFALDTGGKSGVIFCAHCFAYVRTGILLQTQDPTDGLGIDALMQQDHLQIGLRMNAHGADPMPFHDQLGFPQPIENFYSVVSRGDFQWRIRRKGYNVEAELSGSSLVYTRLRDAIELVKGFAVYPKDFTSGSPGAEVRETKLGASLALYLKGTKGIVAIHPPGAFPLLEPATSATVVNLAASATAADMAALDGRFNFSCGPDEVLVFWIGKQDPGTLPDAEFDPRDKKLKLVY